MNLQNDGNRLYIVTGAAGHLGSAVLRCLLKSDEEIRGLILPDESPAVADPRITYYSGDVRNQESLKKIFSGTQGRDVILIHTAALISIAEKAPPELYDVNVNGTKNVLRLCMEYGVKRMVHVSSVHAIPELPQGGIIKEVSSFSASAVKGGYAKTKAEAAQAVLDAVKEGLDAVIVFPSGILGPYDMGRNHLIQMIREYMAGKLPACVKGGYDFVDVRDVADGCRRAACYGLKGEGYILSGHYSGIRELPYNGRAVQRKESCPGPAAADCKSGCPFNRSLCKNQPQETALYVLFAAYAQQQQHIFEQKGSRDAGLFIPPP